MTASRSFRTSVLGGCRHGTLKPTLERAGVGLVVTLGAIGLSEALARTLPEPVLPIRVLLYGFVLLAVVYAAFQGGLVVSLASATAASLYALYHYSVPPAVGIFEETQPRVVLAAAVALLTFVMAALVGWLKTQHDGVERETLVLEREMTGRLEARNRELSEANAALEAFSYVVSHDLKEPIRALEAYTQALREDHAGLLPPEGRDLLARNADAARRLRALVEGLLDDSRAPRAADERPGEATLRDVLDSADCATRYRHLMDERHARLEVEEGPRVYAPLAALCQVLGNVVLNAVRHNPRPEPRVRVRCRPWPKDARFAEVVVEDDGPGFPADVAAAFQPGATAPPRRLRGFGLLISKRVVESMGGRFWVARSEALGGAAVHLTRPLPPPPPGR